MELTRLSFHPPLIAHRGVSASAPENTLAAFKKVQDSGATWVEFDVMLTACGEVVVFHDETLARTTQTAGRIADYSYAHLQNLDAGLWFDPRFAGEKIPSLKQVLIFLEKNSLSANIEIKALPGTEEELAKKVLNLVAQYPSRKNGLRLLSSFSFPVLKILRQASASCLLGVLMDTLLPEWEEMIAQVKSSAVGLDQQHLTAEQVRLLKASGQASLAYTVNTAARALELLAWGVDAVFSDCPDKLLLALPKK